MSARRCLVSGASGFLGLYLMEALARGGNEVVTVGRRGVLGFEHVVCDLSAETPDMGPGRFDTVVHAAGRAHFVPRNADEERSFVDVNDAGTGRLLDALDAQEEPPAWFVHISTVAVYGREFGEGLDEDTLRKPKTAYGRSKAAAEDRVLEWSARGGVPSLVLRLPLIVGRAAPGNLGAMADALRRGRYAGIGSGGARRSMVWAQDVAELVAADGRGAGAYNLTDGRHPTFREVEARLAAALGVAKPRRIPQIAAWAGAMAGSVVSGLTGRRIPLNLDVYRKMTRSLTFADAKARREIGWDPRPALEHIGEVAQ